MLNPSVFKNLKEILTHESVKSIDNEIFGQFKKLRYIQFEAYYFRKLIHKQGIEWMRSKNRGLNVNLSNQNEIYENYGSIFEISIKFFWGTWLTDVFPNADFCLYKDFPFQQFVVLAQYKFEEETYQKNSNDKITCTFAWIARHYGTLLGFVSWFTNTYMNSTLNQINQTNFSCDFVKLIFR